MPSRLLLIWATVTIIPCLANSGCAVITRHRVDVVVLDAETGEPIPNAEVAAYYSVLGDHDPLWSMPLTTIGSSQQTDENGKTSIGVTNTAKIVGEAPNYLVPTVFYPQAASIAPNPEMKGRRATIRLYHEPAPAITIVVPDGYQGPLLVERQPVDRWVGQEVGERQFTFRATDRGYVRIEATPLLLNFDSVASRNLRVQYASGDFIRDDSRVSDEDVVVRQIGSFGLKDIQVIGTKHDQEDLRGRTQQRLDPVTITTDFASIDALFWASRPGGD